MPLLLQARCQLRCQFRPGARLRRHSVIDSKAKKILFDAYWSPAGWRVPPREPSASDAAYAKAAGVMFDPKTLTHDEATERIIDAHSLATAESVARAFVGTLTLRVVHLRPALGSYFAVRQMSPHQFIGPGQCPVCRQFGEWNHDFNSTNLARLKWGWMPSVFPVDHAFVLERFATETHRAPVDAAWAILDKLFAAADDLPASARARDLEQAWKPLLRSNRNERESLIEILVAAGVLVAGDQTAAAVRAIPLKSNWSDGAALWRGRDGVDKEGVRKLFGPKARRIG